MLFFFPFLNLNWNCEDAGYNRHDYMLVVYYIPAYQLLWVVKPFWVVWHTLFTGSWCLSATPQGVCQWQAHTHTLTHTKHHYPWHPAACPRLLVKHPMVLPHSVPLACHFTTGSSFLCLHVPINKSLCAVVREHVQVWDTHNSLHPLKYGCVFPLCISWLFTSGKNLGEGWWKERRH